MSIAEHPPQTIPWSREVLACVHFAEKTWPIAASGSHYDGPMQHLAPVDPRVTLMLDLADRAGTVAMRHFQSDALVVESKADDSPVTAADREIETLLRDGICAAFPADAILGEEHGEIAGTSGWRWVLDPIDGTVSFAAGVPLFGTLIALEHGDEVVAGICAFPALCERLWAVRGAGAWWERTDLAGVRSRVAARVRRCTRLRDALITTTGLEYFESAGATDALVRVARGCRKIRGWSDCYGIALVATGRIDASVEPVMRPWDSGPFPVIFAEAGGVFTDWHGKPDIRGGSAIACHADLHGELLRAVQPIASHAASKANS